MPNPPSCTRKRQFATQHEASRFGEAFTPPQRAYQCNHCRFWHLTTDAYGWKNKARQAGIKWAWDLWQQRHRERQRGDVQFDDGEDKPKRKRVYDRRQRDE